MHMKIFWNVVLIGLVLLIQIGDTLHRNETETEDSYWEYLQGQVEEEINQYRTLDEI